MVLWLAIILAAINEQEIGRYVIIFGRLMMFC